MKCILYSQTKRDLERVLEEENNSQYHGLGTSWSLGLLSHPIRFDYFPIKWKIQISIPNATSHQKENSTRTATAAAAAATPYFESTPILSNSRND
jgi:hypothetical protein